MNTNIKLLLKPLFMSSLLYRELYFFEYAFSVITLKILNPHHESPNIFALYIFVSNVVFIPRYIVDGVQDDISSKTISI